MRKLDIKKVMLSVTIFVVIAYVICRAFFSFLPNETLAFANNIFHATDFSVKPLSWSIFFIGLIEVIILSIAGSALFVWIYNKMKFK
jgi:membrane-associated HD superfamily phosphohydrolase